MRPPSCKGYSRFLSTLSLRRATREKGDLFREVAISIHALLAESDPLRKKPDRPHPDFYPRSPCGERPC